MRQQSYLNSAKKVIESYRGDIPLASFLKKFFSADKKFGSKDRKQVSALCYDYFRLGKALPGRSLDEKILTGTFLCEQSPNDFLAFHRPEWNEIIERPLLEKAAMAVLDPKDVFPWGEELSTGLDHHSFCSSFFLQPDLFLRIRPGKKKIVLGKLAAAGISYLMPEDNCIELANSTKLDSLFELDKEVVIQDFTSQKVLDVLKNPAFLIPEPISVWDCCAASGGKSLLIYDLLKGNMELTVSDIRESILANLKKRFSFAGINSYSSFIADLQDPGLQIQNSNFQLIICDAPCTGSGTWSRTPEQLFFFKKDMIGEYVKKQREIVSNVLPHLQKGGLFIYITCSVFREENEEVAGFIKEKFHLQLLQMELLKGYDKKADSMFVAAFKYE